MLPIEIYNIPYWYFVVSSTFHKCFKIGMYQGENEVDSRKLNCCKKYIVSQANEFHSVPKTHAKQPFTLQYEIVSPANGLLSLERKLFC